MKNLTPVWIHSSLRDQAQRALRRDSLFSAAVHHAFHYQSPLQSALWMDVHKRHAPLFEKPDFTDIFRRISTDAAQRLAGKSVHVIGLGPGGGQKESWLLESLRAHQCSIRYTPIDASLELSLLSAEKASPHVHFTIHPIAGHLSLLDELPDWLTSFPRDEIRVFTAYGLTPNFVPSQLFKPLQSVLRDNDLLLVSANLAPGSSGDLDEGSYEAGCSEVLPQYDNPETMRWLGHILKDWGISKMLTEPTFTIESVESIKGLFAYSLWKENASFEWEDVPFEVEKGSRLRLFFSLRYTPERLARTLEHYGLELGSGKITSCRQEGVWLVSPHPPLAQPSQTLQSQPLA